MPLYEFSCDRCGEFEAWRRIADLTLPVLCPECEGTAKRLFSPPNVNLNSGSLPGGSSKEPRLVKRQGEPAKPRYQGKSQGRPWMIGHTPPRG